MGSAWRATIIAVAVILTAVPVAASDVSVKTSGSVPVGRVY